MVKVEPLIYKLDTYSDDSMFTLYMCLTDVLGASAQAVKVAGSVAAEVLDDASKLAPGLVLLSNDSLEGNVVARCNPNSQNFSDKENSRNWSSAETLKKLDELAVAQQEMQSIGLSHFELKMAFEQFKDVKGFLTKDGPLQKFVNNFQRTDGGLKTAQGAAFELKTALQLEAQNIKILEFGRKVNSREIDIITKKLWIECKDWGWNYADNAKLEKFFSTSGQIKKYANNEGVEYALASHGSIPKSIKDWLVSKNIKFFEI